MKKDALCRRCHINFYHPMIREVLDDCFYDEGYATLWKDNTTGRWYHFSCRKPPTVENYYVG